MGLSGSKDQKEYFEKSLVDTFYLILLGCFLSLLMTQ